MRALVIAVLLLGCASPKVTVYPPRPILEGKQGESPMHFLTRLTVGICRPLWSDALVNEQEKALTDCLGHDSAASCLHEVCSEVWPDEEPFVVKQ